MGSSNKPSRLSQLELDRLKDGLRAAMALPFVDSVRDFVWEVIFSHLRGIDPVFVRSKLLFDVVDQRSRTGWSCKTLKLNKRDIVPGTYEYVIQRADVITKADALGYTSLNLKDDAQRLGDAVLTHWNNKINNDARKQKVASRRYALLLKNKMGSIGSSQRTKAKTPAPPAPFGPEVQFVCAEGEIKQHAIDEIIWQWRMLPTPSTATLGERTSGDSNEGKATAGRGLVGRKKNADGSAGEEAYVWYSNQKQLFEKFTLAEGSFKVVRFGTPTRLPIAKTVELLKQALDALLDSSESNSTAQT